MKEFFSELYKVIFKQVIRFMSEKNGTSIEMIDVFVTMINA